MTEIYTLEIRSSRGDIKIRRYESLDDLHDAVNAAIIVGFDWLHIRTGHTLDGDTYPI